MVVALAVSNRLFAMSSVGQGEADVAEIPFFVLLLLEDLDPHVGDGHGKSVVKANAAEGEGQAKGRHSRDILGHGYDVGVQLMEELIGQHEIHHSLLIHTGAKVLVVATRESTVNVSECLGQGGSR